MAENYYLNHTATQIDAILTKVDGIAAGANVNVQVDWDQTTTTADDYIKNKPTIPDAQIQSDWDQTDTESKDFIKNKPTIPDAQVNSDWEASSGVAQILNKPTLGTAAAKDYTTAVLSLSNDLVTSSAVSTAISTKADLVDGKVPSAQLPSYVDDSIEGYYYEGAFYEDSEHTTVIVGEAGKIYIDLTANKSYRWTGTVYARIDECPAFGETAGTVYEGNKGKQNADNIGTMSSLTTTDKSSLVAAINEVKGSLGTAAAANTTTSITSGGTGLPTSGTIYTDQQRQDAEIGSLVDRGAKNLSPVNNVVFTRPTGAAYTDPISINLAPGEYVVRYKLTTTANSAVAITYDGSEHTFYDSSSPYSDTVITHNFTVSDSCTSFRFYFNQAATVSELMLCTQGDYAATPAFAQYAPTNRELYEMIGDINTVLEGVL